MNTKKLQLMVVLSLFVSITVGQKAIVLQPDSIVGKDAMLYSCDPCGYTDLNYGSRPDFAAISWTNEGNESNTRALVEFDLDTVPEDAIIINAKLSLFSNPTSHEGYHESLTGPNICLLQRVITTWKEDSVTWNNQPSTTTENQVLIPQSEDPYQDYPDIDATEIVKDMINNPSESHGFLFRLEEETPHRRMIFASSDHINDSLHPKLTINFVTDNVFIPDTNFRNFLNSHYPTYMDLSGDSLNIDSAATFAGTFNCSNQNIANLSGIEFFTGIFWLVCNDNQLTRLPDLSAITNLIRLLCQYNQLTALPDFSNNTTLQYLYCENNELTSLPDLSNNTALLHLICNNNQLTVLPDLSSNTSLLLLHVDNNQLSSLPDLSNNVNLSELSCHNNQLTSLPDLSNNTALYDLGCNSNNLTALPDLTANTALKYIYCHSNKLTSLPDLSNCTPLVALICDNNQLISLPDLSSNTALSSIYCTSNQLSSLPDLSGNSALRVFYCGNNKLDFSDARELRIADTLSGLLNFSYIPQMPFGDAYSTCILEGDTAILSIAAQDSALSYQWFKDSSPISGATDTILVIPEMALTDTGIYTCRSYGTALESPPMIWGPGISEFVSAPVTIKINLPCSFTGLNSYYFIWEDSVMLTGSPPGGTFSGPGISGNYFVPSKAGEGNHNITYSYTNTNGCSNSDSQEVEVFNHGGIEQSGLIDDIRIYPNPGKGKFNIEMNTTQNKNIEIKILSSLGKDIFIKELKDYSGSYTNIIDLTGYPSGIYYLQILTGERKITKKIIIE